MSERHSIAVDAGGPPLVAEGGDQAMMDTPEKNRPDAVRSLRTTLEDVLDWLENDGFVEGVHYDTASIVAEIKATLAEFKA